jgi:uncharacterized protein (DUF58 family)
MIPPEVLKKIRHIQIRTRHKVSDVFAGQYHSAFKGQGMEFEEVREYMAGDDIRSIDWNVTARMGHPYIKKFREERELTVMLLVDVSASHQFGSRHQFKNELAAEIGAVLAFSAIRNNDRVGLILFTDEVELYVPPRKGTAHVLRVIREILYFKPRQRGTRIEPALTFLNHVAQRKAVCFLISDFMDDGFQRALRVTGKRHDMIAVVVGDQAERMIPPAGLVEFEDAETGQRTLIDTADPATQRELSKRHQRRRVALQQILRSSGVDAVEVNAGEPYDREFIRFFRMRERRFRA